jgi:hypothetical protein
MGDHLPICVPAPESAYRRLRACLHQGPLSHQVIELAAAGRLGMAVAGQIRLAGVSRDGRQRRGDHGPGHHRPGRRDPAFPAQAWEQLITSPR